MGKRTGENQDYYKHAGKAPSRRLLARERKKVSEARAGESAAGRVPPPGKPAVKATPGAARTVELGRRQRAQREAERVERDEVQRMVDAEAPAAPPDRMLPAARVSTELKDLWRAVQEDARAAWRSGGELYRALWDLARTPVRLARLLRA